jgi:hypothetical protein
MSCKKWFLIAICFSVQILEGVVAQERQTTVGPGAFTCGEVLSDSTAREADAIGSPYFFWAQGYMSGKNNTRSVYFFSHTRQPQAVDLSDAEMQRSWLDDYCRANTTRFFADAVQLLFFTLIADQDLELLGGRVEPWGDEEP